VAARYARALGFRVAARHRPARWRRLQDGPCRYRHWADQGSARQGPEGRGTARPLDSHSPRSCARARCCPVVGMRHLLTDGRGQPFAQLTDLIETAGKVAGLLAGSDVPRAKRCVAHGLRKAALRRLAEAGASTKQICAISGHKTLSMGGAVYGCRQSGPTLPNRPSPSCRTLAFEAWNLALTY
jgi:hypothetical protein